MQIKNGMSSEIVLRNARKAKRSVGVPTSAAPHGYCFLHDSTYSLEMGDEMCPNCERDGMQHIAWREEQRAADIYGEGTGDHDEE